MPIKVHTPNQSNSKTGVPPIKMNSDGNALTSWSISGNTVQAGTPTPSAPVAVDGCGERTINLCPMSFSHSGVGDDLGNVVTMNTRLWSSKIGVLPSQGYYVMVSGEASNHEELLFNRIIQYDANGDFISRISVVNQATAEITTDANCRYIVLDIRTRTLSVDIDMEDIDEVMVSAGAQAPYEPYGYKLPITCGGTTTPIYLGITQTVRRIKKQVLTGTETWSVNPVLASWFALTISSDTPIVSGVELCTHYKPSAHSAATITNGEILADRRTEGLVYNRIIIRDASCATVDDFRTFLQQQYANGTPVTFWYVIAEPKTDLTNEPLMKIGDYADTVASTNTGAPSIATSEGYQTLTVGTTVQPSNVSVSYNLPELSECSRIYVKTDGLPQTKTGITPMTFKANGQPLTAYSIAGNSSQTGTPTPDNPIQPTFCGVRTGNLCNESAMINGFYNNNIDSIVYNEYFRSFRVKVPPGEYTISWSNTVHLVRLYVDGTLYNNPALSIKSYTFTTTDGDVAFSFRDATSSTTPWTSSTMLNTGSTALPYEPYGYKIQITCAGQTTPVYLGQTQTVRKIKKLVLTGDENWSSFDQSGTLLYRCDNSLSGKISASPVDTMLCTVLRTAQSRGDCATTSNSIAVYNTQTDSRPVVNVNPMTLSEWTTFIQQKYAAGTPVTVWYVLATPETDIVNEPLCKIGNYADTVASTNIGAPSIPTVDGVNALSVDTTVQPSSVTIGYDAPEYSEVMKVLDDNGGVVYVKS